MHPLLSFYLRTFSIAIGAVIAIVGVPILIFVFFISNRTSDMCATSVLEEIVSPSGKLKLVLHQIDCGASTKFNSQVVIVPSNIDTSQKNVLPRSFFVAEQSSRAPPGKGGGPEVRLRWQSDSRVELQHHTLARLIRAEDESNGVAIAYRTFH